MTRLRRFIGKVPRSKCESRAYHGNNKQTRNDTCWPVRGAVLAVNMPTGVSYELCVRSLSLWLWDCPHRMPHHRVLRARAHLRLTPYGISVHPPRP